MSTTRNQNEACTQHYVYVHVDVVSVCFRPDKYDHNTLEAMLGGDEGPAPALPPRGIAPHAGTSHATQDVGGGGQGEDGERTLVVRKVRHHHHAWLLQ